MRSTFAMAPALAALTVALAGASWEQGEHYRSTELAVPRQGQPGLTLLEPGTTGVGFTNLLSEYEAARNRVLVDGSGVAAGDYDNDGLVDLFFCGIETPCRLFRNLGGWKFIDATESAGLALQHQPHRGAVFADVNGDGWLDLLVTAHGQGILCFLNDGKGRYKESAPNSPLASMPGATTAALADVDGNGTLDLYVAAYRSEDVRDRPQIDLHLVNGKLSVPPALKDRILVAGERVFEFGEADRLFLNDGRGRFRAVPWSPPPGEIGVAPYFRDAKGQPLASPPLDWGLSATFRDMNGDGAPDLYVCNDYWTPDRLWINDGHGRFQAAGRGILPYTSANSMGVDCADIDRDGVTDFFVVDMLGRDAARRKRSVSVEVHPAIASTGLAPEGQRVQNTLYHGGRDGAFEELAWFAGVAATGWSWQPLFCDLDLDGYEDLLIGTGHWADIQDMDANAEIDRRPQEWRQATGREQQQAVYTRQRMIDARRYPRLDMPLAVFRNQGHFRFEEKTSTWSPHQPGIHHGMAMADLDGDGDLDLVVNCLNSPARLYRNEGAAARVAVRLRGSDGNTQAIGARTTLEGGAVPQQSLEAVSGGRYLSGGDPLLVFAAGTSARPMTLTVRWRNGAQTRIEDVKANWLYEVTQPRSQNPAGSALLEKAPAPFADQSHRLEHTHHDDPVDRNPLQTMNPRRLAESGPAAAWMDLNGDGWDDAILGAGKGGKPSVFLADGKGSFTRMSSPALDRIVTRDQTSVLGLARSDGKTWLLAGSSNEEDGLNAGPAARQYDLASGIIVDDLPGHNSSTGPLCLGDIDGDGELDLFVGGRALPERYPEAASSRVFLGRSGRWHLDEPNSRTLERVGLVTSAVLADLTGDGWPDLVLACEWGPIRVFKNNHGHFQEATEALRLGSVRGLWNSVAAGDFDGDGRLDLIAGNAGSNSELQASEQEPLAIFSGPFRGTNSIGFLEAQFNPASNAMEPLLGLAALSVSFPWLRERFDSHQRFGEASMNQVLAAMPQPTKRLQATTLASTLFLNRGPHFESAPLPDEAQHAAMFGIAVADFDGDGREDAVLCPGERNLAEATALNRAATTLWLRGSGQGGFAPASLLPAEQRAGGDQRGAAVADYNRDGRSDLLITQYRGPTRLLMNQTARPGLRVRLEGSPGNPQGVGAVLRLKFGDHMGAARAITSGSGYFSQDSATVVLATPVRASQIWIRWPGGHETLTDLPPGAFEVTVRTNGALSVPKP